MDARSVRKKTIAISENIIENDVDLFVVTETWLTEEDPFVIGELLPQDTHLLVSPERWWAWWAWFHPRDQHQSAKFTHKY